MRRSLLFCILCMGFILLGLAHTERFAQPDLKQFFNDLQNSVITHPNPAQDFVVFDYSLATANAQIMLTDVAGKVIHSIDLSNLKGEIIWDTREVAAGVYFYNVSIKGSNILMGKIMIEK